MTLLISDSYRASVFLLTFLLYTLVFFIFLSAPQLTSLFFFAQHSTKEKWCWPMSSFLRFALPYNYSRSVSCQMQWPGLSPWLRAVLTDRWASQLMPLLFLSTRGMFAADVHACRLLPSLPDQGFEDHPLGDGLSIADCSKWSELLSTKSITSSFRHLVAYVLRAVPCWSQWGKKINERKKTSLINKSNNLRTGEERQKVC